MTRIPVVSGPDAVRALGRLGYVIARQRGSHASLRADGRPPLTVPMHDELAPGTLRAILRAANLTVEEFLRLLD